MGSGSSGGPAISISLPGVDNHDTERRRQIALKALKDRLSKTEQNSEANKWPSLDQEDETSTQAKEEPEEERTEETSVQIEEDDKKPLLDTTNN